MAYLCSRCEADEHPTYTYSEVRSSHIQAGNFTVTAWCEHCQSNTNHIIDTEYDQ